MEKSSATDLKLQARLLSHFEILQVLQKLGLRSLAKQCGLEKQQGEDGLKVFVMLFLAVFTSTTINEFIRKSQLSLFTFRKDVAYRYTQRRGIHWRKLLYGVAKKAISRLGQYTPGKGIYLAIDDSQLHKSGKRIEYLSWVYNKSLKRSVKGYEVPCLSYTDGTSSIPLDFALKASEKRVCSDIEAPADIDGRELAAKRRAEVSMKKTSLVLGMLRRAQSRGIEADAVLFDSWFCHAAMIDEIYHEIGYNVCAQLKTSPKIMVTYRAKRYSTKRLWDTVVPQAERNIIKVRNVEVEVRSIRVIFGQTPVKLVFCRPVDKQSHFKAIILLSTLTHQNEKEIIDAYTNRWSIETLFKELKHTWDFGKNQSRNFESYICMITISMIRSIVFTIMQRQDEDYRYKGTLFEMTECELHELNTLFNLSCYIKTLYELCGEKIESSVATFIEKIDAFQQRVQACVANILFQRCET